MFTFSVKTSTPATSWLQIVCLALVSAFWALPALAQSGSATSETMASQVREWLGQTHGVKAAEVVIAPLDARLQVQHCNKALQVDHPFSSKGTVRVRCAEPAWQLYLQVTLPVVVAQTPAPAPGAPSNAAPGAVATGPGGGATAAPARNVVVAKRLLQRGTLVQADMLEEKPAPSGPIDSSWLSTVKDAQQAELVRDVPAGQPMRSSDIRRAVLVKQGQSVMLTMGAGAGFQVTVSMEAMQDGRLGEQVRLKNPETGRLVTGVVTGANAAKGI